MPGAKPYFQTYHLTAAAHNARIAGMAEEKRVDEGREGKFRNESLGRWQVIHDGLVITSFIESFASIEATINEFLDYESPYAWDYRDDIDELLTIYPGDFIRDESTPKKYQIILAFLDKEPFDTGEEPYQNMDIIRRLRNFFIHHDPIWSEGTEEEPETRIGKALKTKEFTLNPFRPDEPFFPGRCISYDCAKWVFLSALQFIDDFYNRIDVSPPYSGWEENLKAELRTDWIEKDPNW